MFIKHVPIRHGEVIIRKFSNGTYNVRTIYELVSGIKTYCLNPCSNGIWSLTFRRNGCHSSYGVLILVLMEYGL